MVRRNKRHSDIKTEDKSVSSHHWSLCFNRNGLRFLLINESAIYGPTGAVITSGDNRYDRDVICSTNWLPWTGDHKIDGCGKVKLKNDG